MQIYESPVQYMDPAIRVATSIAQLRAQVPPSFSGATAGVQTYSLALVLGSAGTIGTNAAWYVWDATSALADNNSTVISPTGFQVGGNPGRWVIIGATL